MKIYWNDEDLSSFGVTVLRTNFPYLPKPKVDIQEIPFGEAKSQKKFYSPREFEVNVLIEANSLSQLSDYLSALFLRFAEEYEQWLRFDDFHPNYQFLARYMGGLESAQQLGLYSLQATLNFIAPNPAAMTVATYEDSEEITSTSHSFTITPVGNFYAIPLWTIKANTGSGNITFTNTTTNEVLTYSESLSNNNWLSLNSDRQYADKTTNSGSSWTNQMIHISGKFPRLAGGVTNNLIIEGVNSGSSIEWYYRGRIM